MATITSLNSTDDGETSRGVINTNFTNLNTDKGDIDTDTTLSANSDTLVPSQKAIKAYVDAAGLGNASDSQKGVVEEATDAEIAASTATGSTGARLYINPSYYDSALTQVPKPLVGTFLQDNSGFSSDTTATVALYHVPQKMTVNKITVLPNAVTSGSAIDMTMYSEDGQTQIFSVTSASPTAYTRLETSVSSVSIKPGNYWFVFNPNGSVNFALEGYDLISGAFEGTASISNSATEPVIYGTLTITAGTPPTTFDPTTDITVGSGGTSVGRPVIFRLDN